MANETELVVDVGPVSGGELAKVQWSSPTKVVAIPIGIGSKYDCSGPMTGWSVEQHVDCHGSTAFRAYYDSLGQPGPGETKADVLLRKLNLVRPWHSKTLTSFSAGHGLVEPMLRDAAMAWDAVLLQDSYYTGAPALKAGMLVHAQLAAQGSKLFIATCSGSGNATTRPCNECIVPLIKAIGAQPVELQWPGGLKPKQAWARGKFLVGDFGMNYSHGDQAKVVAPQIMQGWISPFLTRLGSNIQPSDPAPWEAGGSKPVPSEPLAPWWHAPLGLAGAAAAIAAAMLAAKALIERKDRRP